MEEFADIINRINMVLNTINSAETETEKRKIFEANLDVFTDFQLSLDTILRLYQFKEDGDITQNDISDRLKNVVTLLLKNGFLFEQHSQFQYLESSLLDALSYNENKFAFNLQYENNGNKAKTAIEYLETRKSYFDILDENDNFKGQSLNESSAINYRSNTYEKNMLGHALMQIKDNFLNMSQEDIVKIIHSIDGSGVFEELLQKSPEQMNFYDKNLISQYAETVLKLKSIFTPEMMKDDVFVQAMWNGKIQDPKTLQAITKNISIDSLDSLLAFSNADSQIPYLINLSEHFRQVGFSDKNIALLISEILDKGISPFEIAALLARIDTPKDLTEFANSEHSQEFSWLLEGPVFQTLKDSEKSIEDARYPYLPAEYYTKKLDVIKGSGADQHFIQNLLTLLHSDFYTDEEKSNLTASLKKNGYYYPIISDEEVTFAENDTPITTYKKALGAYYSGQVIPLNVATSLLNKLITLPKLTSDQLINTKLLEACVQSVVSNQLAEKGIDIGNRVFFGNGHSNNSGYYQNSTQCIWIDRNLIDKFIGGPELTDKAPLFRTMFHEMQHAVQYHNIENGNINFLGYNFVKEFVLRKYDENYYDSNYRGIFTESDARREEILGSLEFLKGLNPSFVKVLRSQAEKDYIDETYLHPVYGDTNKKIDIGKNGTRINISDYVGFLIQSNPQILTDYPILSIEYNPDGSQKSLETLLQDFQDKKSENTPNYSDTYSIYYGLISKSAEQCKEKTPELQEQLSSFLQEQPELISLEDMHVQYQKVPVAHVREMYSRLLSITRNLSPVQVNENSVAPNTIPQEGADLDDNDSR